MSDKKPVPPSLAQFAIEQLAEAGEQAAIDLTVQNVEILRQEIVKRDARIANLERLLNNTSEIAQAVEQELTALKEQQRGGVVLPEWAQSYDAMGDRLIKAGWRDLADAQWSGVKEMFDEFARLNPPPDRVSVLPEPFEMRPFQTVDQGSTNYKAGFNAALRKVRESLNSPTISDGCDTCHGQGEVWSGETAYQGHFQPPEPIMDVCPECSGESVPTVSAGVTLPDDFVCGSKPLQDLLNATAMLLETPSHDSATYWAAQLANVEALLKPVIAGVVDERAAFEAWWKSYPLGDLVDPSDQAHRHIGLKIWQARAAQPDHSELNLVMATVPRELLKRVVGADASMGANAFQLADGWKAMDELRALLAQHEGDKS